MSGFLVDKDSGMCPCGRACCQGSAFCVGLGRTTGNCSRSIPWASTGGLLFTFVGAGFAFKGLDELHNALKRPNTLLELQDYYDWIVVAIWATTIIAVIMFLQGVFSTGKGLEYCCRKTIGRRRGKCSCRAICRASACCTFSASWFVMIACVIGAFAFSCATLGAFTAKKVVDLTCNNVGPCTTDPATCGVTTGALESGFQFNLPEYGVGPLLRDSCEMACHLCEPLAGTDKSLLKFWWGSVSILLGMGMFLMATTANSAAVRQERTVARPAPQSKRGISEGKDGVVLMDNPVRPTGAAQARVEIGDWA